MIADEIGRTGEAPSTRGALVVALLLGLVVGLVALAVLLKMYVPGFEDPGQWQKTAECVGASAAGTAFAVWILIYFGYVVWRAPGRGLAYLLILILGLTAGEATALGLFVFSKRVERDYQQANSRATDAAISQVTEAVLRSDEGGRFTIQDFSTAPGEMGEIGRVTMIYMGDINESVEIERDQGYQFFHPDPVFKKPRLTEADLTYMRDTVAMGHTAIEGFWKSRDTALATFRSNLASAALSAETKNKVLAAFDDAARSGAAERDSVKALDEALLDRYDALLKAMRRYVSLQSGYANMVDVEDAANRLNAAIRDVNTAIEARNRRIEAGMGSSEAPHQY